MPRQHQELPYNEILFSTITLAWWQPVSRYISTITPGCLPTGRTRQRSSLQNPHHGQTSSLPASMACPHKLPTQLRTTTLVYQPTPCHPPTLRGKAQAQVRAVMKDKQQPPTSLERTWRCNSGAAQAPKQQQIPNAPLHVGRKRPSWLHCMHVYVARHARQTTAITHPKCLTTVSSLPLHHKLLLNSTAALLLSQRQHPDVYTVTVPQAYISSCKHQDTCRTPPQHNVAAPLLGLAST